MDYILEKYETGIYAFIDMEYGKLVIVKTRKVTIAGINTDREVICVTGSETDILVV